MFDERRGTLWRLAVLYAALTVLLAYPLSVHPGSTVMSRGPDTDLFVWILSWDTHAFVHQPLSIFDTNVYYPQRHTLAYSENLIGSAFFAAPVIWLTGNPALAMNLVALASAVLCAMGAWLLARRVGVGAAGAVIAGVVFGFAPSRFLRIEQLHLATIQWVPFCLAFVHAYLDEGRPLYAWLAAGLFTLEALSTGHGVVFLIVAVAALIVYRTVRGEPLALAKSARDVGIIGALMLLPTALMFVPYLIVQRETGLKRTLDNWTVSAQSFLASPSHVHGWILSWVPGLRINERADAYLFPGYLPVALALVAVVVLARGRVRRESEAKARAAIGFYLVLTLLCVWLSVGPPVSVWPYVYWLPGFNLIRVPSRFMLLGMLGIAVLAGFGFERLIVRLSRVRATSIAAIVTLLLAGEFAADPFEVESYSVDIAPIDRWIATQPAPVVVAEVPMANPSNLGAWERRQTLYMLHSTAHWQKTVHGYSGFRPPLHERLFQELTRFPDEASVRTLSEIGVTHVVVHTDYYEPAEWTRVEAAMRRFPALVLDHVEGAGRVYRLQR